MNIGWEEVRALRLARHQLHERAPRGSELRAVSQICGLHAQLLSSAALSTYRYYLTQGWVRYFGITHEEIELVIAAVGEALRGRVLTRAQLAEGSVKPK